MSLDENTSTPNAPFASAITPISIVEEMKTSYLDYAMSVIVARALPDVRDGLKPVHRRILYACEEAGYVHDKSYRKSSRIVGDVMGKYHPHGDSAIYMSLVRMAQDWAMRVPLVDGQGNFGSMDPDEPAAMRYTEARLAKVANALLDDLDKDTVNFTPNYDGSESEPQVLPARFPNLLVNGASGIAVGMATNIPPHNLGEVLDGCIALIDTPEISLHELIHIIPGPDFPTGCTMLGNAGARAAYHKGRGAIILRSTYSIEEGRNDRRSIVLTEIPYQQGKNALVAKIAECARDKLIEGVSEVRDESNRLGVRIVLDLKRDTTADVVLNQLWRNTPAQSSFSANMLAIRGGRPEVLNLRDILTAFIGFREEVITRRCKFELNKARARAHILLGLVLAVTHLDEVVALIRSSPSPQVARERLLERTWPITDIAAYVRLVEAGGDALVGESYRLSETQARAILELRLNRLTALGRDEIEGELKQLAVTIAELLDILADRAKLYAVMRGEFVAIKEEFATPRKTLIANAADEIEDEDLLEREEMVVTVTLGGYIKRTALDTYRAQARGGKGRAGMDTKDEDVVSDVFVTSTHTPVLFFSSLGKVYRLKVWRLPEGNPAARGRPLVNLLPLAEGETISTILPLPEDEKQWGSLDLMFATAHGQVRRNAMEQFAYMPPAGKYAFRFEEGSEDKLIGVALLQEGEDVLLASRNGQAVRFSGEDIRASAGRSGQGVRGIALEDGDELISLTILRRSGATPAEREAYLAAAPWKENETPPTLSPERMADMAAKEQFILTVTANGFGKKSSSYEYRRTNRGGKGIVNIGNTERNGHVVASFPVENGQQLLLVSNQAKLIRIDISGLRVLGRNSGGVRLFHVAGGEHVASVARIEGESA